MSSCQGIVSTLHRVHSGLPIQTLQSKPRLELVVDAFGIVDVLAI